MYRCEVCYDVSQPGQPQLRHVIQRQRPKTPFNSGAGTEIAREVCVCRHCQSMLSGSTTYQQVYRAHRKMRASRMDEEKREKRKRRLFRKEAERMPRKYLDTFVARHLENEEERSASSLTIESEIIIAPARMIGRVVTPETNHHAQQEPNHANRHETPKRKPHG